MYTRTLILCGEWKKKTGTDVLVNGDNQLPAVEMVGFNNDSEVEIGGGEVMLKQRQANAYY